MESLPTTIPPRALTRIRALHTNLLAAQAMFNEALSVTLETMGYDTQATIKPNVNIETGLIVLPTD